MEPQSHNQVSSAEVQQLYKGFRKAALESTARELQKKEYEHFSQHVEPSVANELLSPEDDVPNQFDSYLNTIAQVKFLGLRFHKMPQVEAVEAILRLTQTGRTYRVYFANAHSIEVASRNADFFTALKRSNLLLADGSGVLLGSRLAGHPLTHNLNGTDLIPALCQAASPQRPLSIFLLGAKPGIADKAAVTLAAQSKGVKIAGVQNGYFAETETPEVLQRIRDAKPDVLLVAMGTPRQEIWIDKYSHQLPGVICIAVGGLFDFMAGQVPRAPKLFRNLGVEWVWRMMMEPDRLWKRYTIGNLVYLKVLSFSLIREVWLRWQGNGTLDGQPSE